MENTYVDSHEFDFTKADLELIEYLLTGGTRTIDGKKYVVKSVFLDSGRNIKDAILKLAERKAVREMGLDIPLEFERDITL